MPSSAGRRGIVGAITHGAIKAGAIGMGISAACDWAHHGIRVTTACVGATETPMKAVIRGAKLIEREPPRVRTGRITQPGKVAKPWWFLLSDAAS